MNHLEFAANESAQLVASPWEKWAMKVEKMLGHHLDGDQATDGYSVDYAHEAYTKGLTVQEYVAQVKKNKEGI